MLLRIIKALFSMIKSPARMPGRSWATELFARTMRDMFVDSQGFDVTWLRNQIDSASLPNPAVRKVRLENKSVGGVACLVATPKQDGESDRAIVYFHGGGYVFGSTKGYKGFVAELAVKSGCVVVAPDYRLAPENPFPAPQDDCLTVVTECIEAYKDKRVILAGDSAGGGLALSVALEFSNSAENPIDSLVLISPWVDPMAQGGTIVTNAENDLLLGQFLSTSYEALMQGADLYDSRVNFTKADLSGLPPMLIQYAGGELFFDQINEFAERAKSAGVDVTLQNYPTQFHVFQLLSTVLKDAKDAMVEITRFINRS